MLYDDLLRSNGKIQQSNHLWRTLDCWLHFDMYFILPKHFEKKREKGDMILENEENMWTFNIKTAFCSLQRDWIKLNKRVKRGFVW